MLVENVIHPPGFFLLGSIEAMRPVFTMVMGLFLLLVVWRLAGRFERWPARLFKAGASLLALGYAVVLPAYGAGKVAPLSQMAIDPGSPAVILGWHILKIATMNFGWAMVGTGLALHVRLFETVRTAKPVTTPTAALHEPVA